MMGWDDRRSQDVCGDKCAGWETEGSWVRARCCAVQHESRCSSFWAGLRHLWCSGGFGRDQNLSGWDNGSS